MRILHVISPLTKGGAERVAVELANSFSRSGDEVAILVSSPADPELLQCEVDRSVDLRFVSAVPRPRLATYPLALKWIHANRDFIASRDIIHCHLSFGSVFGGLVTIDNTLRRRGRPKVVETYHAVGMPMSGLRWRLTTVLAASHDGLVTMATDPAIADFLNKNPRLPHALIPNGIKLPFPQATPEEVKVYREVARIPIGAVVVGSVGRLVPDRRPEIFVEVFKHIARARPDVHFLMAGEGSERERIIDLAQRAGIEDRLHLPGLARRAALPLALIDLYLTLNVGPITGIAALEAIASNLPAVAFQADSTYSGERDWIYSSADPSKVAGEIFRLLDSPEQMKALAAAQREELVQNRSLEAMANAYRVFYEKVLEFPPG